MTIQGIKENVVLQGFSIAELDEKHRALAPFLVLAPDYRGMGDFRQVRNQRLDLGRINPFAAGLYQILRTPCNKKLAVLADLGKVACWKPAISCGGLRLSEIALHD